MEYNSRLPVGTLRICEERLSKVPHKTVERWRVPISSPGPAGYFLETRSMDRHPKKTINIPNTTFFFRQKFHRMHILPTVRFKIF